MSVYPDAIDTYRQPENQPGTDINDAPSTAIFAEHFGDISDAVRRTQQTLGLNPNGEFDTVAERLAAAAVNFPENYTATIYSGNSRLHTFGMLNAASGTNTNVVNHNLYAVPFMLQKSITITDLLAYCNGAAAGSTVELGIYSNVSGYEPYPDSLLATSGALATTSTGLKDGSVTYTLNAGTLYWAAMLANGGSPGMSVMTSAAMYPYFGVDVSGTGTVGCYLAGSIFPATTLPSTAPTGLNISGSAMPRIMYAYN